MRKYLGRPSAGLTGLGTADGDFVEINPATGNYLGVGAHEWCHASQYSTDEPAANACAARNGMPNPYAG